MAKYRLKQDGEYKGKVYRMKVYTGKVIELTKSKDIPKHLFEEIKPEKPRHTAEEKKAMQEAERKKAEEEKRKAEENEP